MKFYSDNLILTRLFHISKKINKGIVWASAIFVFYLIIILIPGCVPSKPTEEVEILPAERLVAKLEVNRRRIRTFDGTGTLLVKTPQMDNSASFQITLVKPDSIYLTIMGPFGIQLAEALVTDNNFIFYDALHNTAYEGELSEDVLKNIFKIDLPFSDIIDAFVGSVNLTKHLYSRPTKYSVDYDKYILTYFNSATEVTTEYKIDIRSLGITNFKTIDAAGKVMLDGKYSDFDYIQNVSIPYTIDVQDKRQDEDVTIKYKTLHANEPGTYISFNVPSDATVIKW